MINWNVRFFHSPSVRSLLSGRILKLVHRSPEYQIIRLYPRPCRNPVPTRDHGLDSNRDSIGHRCLSRCLSTVTNTSINCSYMYSCANIQVRSFGHRFFFAFPKQILFYCVSTFYYRLSLEFSSFVQRVRTFYVDLRSSRCSVIGKHRRSVNW